MQETTKVRLWLTLMTLALIALVTAGVLYFAGPGTTASRFGRAGRGYGTLAAWALGATVALGLANLLGRRYLKVQALVDRKGKVLKQEYQRTLILKKRWFINLHLAAGIVGFLAAVAHAHLYWQFRNVWLILAMVLFAWMVAVGVTLKWGGIPPSARRYVYLLHSQWVTVVLLVIVTIVGHVVLRN